MTDIEDVVKAVQAGESMIIVEGKKLSGEIYRIIITKDIAWTICIGGIAIAAVSVGVTIGSGGTAAPATAPAGLVATAPVVASLGGVGVATTAITIAAIGGGVGVLTRLRGYRAERISDDKLILHKK